MTVVKPEHIFVNYCFPELFKMMSNLKKIKVLYISPDFFSGIGLNARHIADSAIDIDSYFFSSADINKHKNAFLKLAAAVDIIHWLANLSWVKLSSDIHIHEFQAPNIATIYHIDERVKEYRREEETNKISRASECDAINVVSREWETYIRSRTTTPVFLAHHVINPDRFIPNRVANRPRASIRIGTFGFAKEIRDRKRVDVLLDALVILAQQHYRFEFIVQGPYWTNLERFFIDRGVKIINLGNFPPQVALNSYRYIDLYICSSDIEGGPVTVPEALASGVPVISTPVGVAAEALAIGGGILVKKDSPEDLAMAIARIIDNPSLYRQLSQEAIEVSGNYTWDKIGKEYKTMYESVLNHKKTSRKKYYSLGNPRLQRSLQLTLDIRRQRAFSNYSINYTQLLKMIFRGK